MWQPLATRGGDAAGHPTRRPGGPVPHGGLGPFGGHETGLLWHYLGGARAARRYTRRHGHRPKNDYGSSLFDVSAADGLRWAAGTGRLVAAFPVTTRDGVVADRGSRCGEFLVSNLVLVLAPADAGLIQVLAGRDRR